MDCLGYMKNIPEETFHMIDMSNEKNPGWLGNIGDEILPRYIGIIMTIIRILINQPV